MDSQTAPFQKGDVVAIYSPNQHDYLAIVLGIHLVGGVAALCNPSYKAAELAHQLRMTRSRCIITTAAPAAKPGENTLDKAREALRLACSSDDDDAQGGFAKLPYSPAVFVFEEGEQDSWDAICQKVQVTEEVRAEVDERSRQVHGSDAAVLCFSSGTSGLPKAVILTHSNLVANTIQASFLLHDRMNEPLVDGKKYSQDGNTGWYDEAQKSGAGRQVEPDGAVNEQATTEAASTGEKTTGETTTKVKATMGAKLQKMATARLPSFFLRGGDTSKGQKRIASRQAGRQEFHIDVLPQFHCYGLLVNLVALHTSISDHGVTFSFVVPPILLALAKHPLVERYDVSTLWRVASGAASLPDEIAVAIGKRLGIRCTDGEWGAGLPPASLPVHHSNTLLPGYGMTESESP
ncbi:hypothetical protein L7F22_031229 [Adiantum nelumboides]|nr:hypothetical protein [Adiantum nelumboides]